MPTEINKLNKLAKKIKSIDLKKLSKAELLKIVEELTEAAMNFAPKFQLANNNAGGAQTFLEMFVKKFAPEDYSEICSGLMSGSSEITSAEQGYRLYDLAKTARKDPEAARFFSGNNISPEELKKLDEKSPFMAEFKIYLEDFGHRAVYEGEIANPRWNDDPTFLLEQVQQIIAGGETEDPRLKAIRRRKAAEQLVGEKVFFLFRPLVFSLAEKARKNYSLRETAKATLAVIFEPTRNLMLDIGRRLTEDSRLNTASDIFDLSLADIRSYILDEWDGRGAFKLTEDRKKQRELWKQQNPADVIITDKDGNSATFDFATAKIEAPCREDVHKGKPVLGIGVASGIASGRVRIIMHPSEGYKLEKGDILVAPSTDPGWTPLFLRASAIVMEVGGYLSHGAIVSREYGIPAVVNIPGILDLLEDGQMVTVNGNKGEIIVQK